MKYQMPEPVELNPLANSVMGYTYTQMQSAYDAGRLAGLEEAAHVCDYENTAMHDKMADAIRNLAKETP